MLTLVVGGNHEASNFLQSLAYGGWLAPNIYYVGYASVLKFGSLRLGALSGIYKGGDYMKGHYERPPYDQSSMRSAYHVRNAEAFRLKQVRFHWVAVSLVLAEQIFLLTEVIFATKRTSCYH